MAGEKSRVIVSTDIGGDDADDYQSMATRIFAGCSVLLLVLNPRSFGRLLVPNPSGLVAAKLILIPH